MTKDKKELEANYEELMRLYDFADELADTVDSRFVADAEAQYHIVEPLIDQIGESTDVLTEEFINLAEGQEPMKSRGKIETALRKIYAAVDGYCDRVQGISKGSRKKAANIADAIVQKIKAELERVIVIFLDFVKLNLDTVMHKKELDELKRNQTMVNLHLHQMAQQPQP